MTRVNARNQCFKQTLPGNLATPWVAAATSCGPPPDLVRLGSPVPCQIYALKSANKRQLTKSVGSFRIEVEILQSLNHPNIIKVFEIIDDPNSQARVHASAHCAGCLVAC